MRPLGRHITDDLRDLADAVERISQRFGWTSPAVDRDLTGAPGPIANSHDAWSSDPSGLQRVWRYGSGCAVVVGLHR